MLFFLELGVMAIRYFVWVFVWAGCGLDVKLIIVRGDRVVGSKVSGVGFL